MAGARLAVKVVVSLSFCRDFHPAALRQLAWRTRLSLATLASVSLTLRTFSLWRHVVPGFHYDVAPAKKVKVDLSLTLYKKRSRSGLKKSVCGDLHQSLLNGQNVPSEVPNILSSLSVELQPYLNFVI